MKNNYNTFQATSKLHYMCKKKLMDHGKQIFIQPLSMIGLRLMGLCCTSFYLPPYTTRVCITRLLLTTITRQKTRREVQTVKRNKLYNIYVAFFFFFKTHIAFSQQEFYAPTTLPSLTSTLFSPLSPLSHTLAVQSQSPYRENGRK